MRLAALVLCPIATNLQVTNWKYLSATAQQGSTVQGNKKGKFVLNRIWKISLI